MIDTIPADLFDGPRRAGHGGNALVEPLRAQFDRVPNDWRALTDAFVATEVGRALCSRIDQRRQAGAVIYPGDVFRALHLTPRRAVRVVILGQDPYHGPGRAQGLAFSVPSGQPLPPSLRNITKELRRDLGVSASSHGCLEAWAHQGVLLLNTCLTVEAAQAASHSGWGWEILTDAIVSDLAQHGGPKVFMLWGAHAQRKRALVEAGGGAHLVLCANHPSPLSATRGPTPFIGCGHFSAASRFVERRGEALIWGLE